MKIEKCLSLQTALHEVMPLYETLFDSLIRWKLDEVHKYFHDVEVSDKPDQAFL